MARRMAAATAHVLPEASSVRDGRLTIGGCDAEALAREHGTPAYVFAEDDLRARAREFTAALAAHHDGQGEVVFASKACPCTAVLRVFVEEGLGCDVASGGELHLALHAGFAPERVYLHGNAKSEAELAQALDAGVGTIVLDNAHEAQRLSALLQGRTQRVLLRVTPGVDADTHEAILTGQAGSKFGFAPGDAAALIAQPPPGLQISGLHMHLGSQLFALEPYERAIAALATLGDFGTYDLGGGLGVPYTAADPELDVTAWVSGVVAAAHARLGAAVELVLEPGRALTATAGVTLYTVESVKPGAAGELLVAVDGGMSDNLRPMLYGASYEGHIATRMGDEGVACTIVGKHCESGDVLVRDARLPDPRPGDVLVTPATGAYGYAMANTYNGQPRPPVIFCKDGASRAVVRRETYEELHGRDV
jgi:diaminopimelate decarboxylase